MIIKLNQYPRADIIAFDNVPCHLSNPGFAIGKLPLAKNIIATPFVLSAQIYEPLTSANPNELALNLVPQGGLVKGTVSHPKALVFLYFEKENFVVN